MHEVWTFDLETYLARVRELRHIDTALRALADEEIEAGLASILNDPAHRQGTVAHDLVLNLIALHLL